MLKWTVCQQRQSAVGAGSSRTPGPGPGHDLGSCNHSGGSSGSSSGAVPSVSPASAKAFGMLAEQDAEFVQARAARRVARRSARRLKEHEGPDGDKENVDTPEQPAFLLALRDVSNHGTPTALGMKTPESGKKRSRSQCRDITNIPAASRSSLDPPRSRSSGSGRPSLSATATPELKKPRGRAAIQPYEDDAQHAEVQAAWAAQPSREAQLKYLPRQRTTSSGVARIRLSRDLAKAAPKATKTPRGSRSAGALSRRQRRRKPSALATPRFVRPAVGTAADAARCAVVVPLETTKGSGDPDDALALSPRTVTTASTSPALAAEPDASAVVAGEDSCNSASPGESLLSMLDRIAAEEEVARGAAGARSASPIIDYSPCPLRSTQSLLALRRRLFDTSVMEPDARTGRLAHGDAPRAAPLPLTTPLIAAFNRWHRLRDTAHLVGAESTPGPQPPAGTLTVSGVSPLACRLAWLRLQSRDVAQGEVNPPQSPFPPFGHDGRYLAAEAPQPAPASPRHHSSSPQLNNCLLSSRRRRISGSAPNVHATDSTGSFRVPSTPTPGGPKRSRCCLPSLLASDTLSLLNHGPSSASLSSLCSLFPGYRPPSIACSSAASLASSLSDIPAMASSPLADASLLKRQRCVRRRRRTTLDDDAHIEAVLSSVLHSAASCPNIATESEDREVCGSVSPPGLSSSGYSSSTTANEPLERPRAFSSATSTASLHGLEVTTTAATRYGLTLPTGIPSPESPPDAASCRPAADASTLVDQFMCSTPLLPRAAAAKAILGEKPMAICADHSHALAGPRPHNAEASDFDSASLLVNRGSPAARSDDTWDSHRVQKVVQTTAVRGGTTLEDDSITDSNHEYVPPSPLALVERRCRSRKGLLFASPGNSAAMLLDPDLGEDAASSCILTPSSGSSYASSPSSCRVRRRSTPWRRASKDIVLPGELELNICALGDQLTIHVVRGSGLRRPGGDSCNAYVKVSLVAGATEEKTFRRTCVHRDSSQPFFDHKFSFEVHEADLEKRVLVSVWHRDRPKRRSEFLGCMSFAVKHAVQKEVSGTFRLLPQSVGRSQNVPAQAAQAAQAAQQLDVALAGPVGQAPDACTATQDPERDRDQDRAPAERRRAMYSSRTMESVATSTALATVDRSEDSTFLRHLELEPTGPDGVALPPLPLHPQAAARPPGRTPFTSTRRLQRTANGGFGFSVAWTQPPRVERVEPGLAAEQAGIRPGDYIIFVERHNVVTVPEEEVLRLIRSCGNQLTLEVYRRNSPNGMVPQSKSTPAVGTATKAKPVPSSASTSSALLSRAVTASNVATSSPIGLATPDTPGSGHRQPPPPLPLSEPRPSTACSAATAGTNASDMGKRRLHLPQVTFTTEAGQLTADEARKRVVYQLLSKEQSFSLALQFGVSRFLVPLSERRDLIAPAEHQTLFQNVQEILRITDDVLERLIQEDGEEPLVNSVAQVYTAACPQMTQAYHRYCSGLKNADALLVNKTRNPEFMRSLNEPPVPRRRPDITAFLHKPLEHYREVLKLLQTIHNFTRHSDDEYPLLTKAVHEFQAAYRGLTTSSGIMEPEGEGRPLLTLQDVESRLVFTKCKPFSLAASGRRWLFGGDLVRVEGRAERRYWALLFTDLLLFSQVSRDRVLFVSEEPLRLITITQAAFSVKRKATEFRLMVDGSSSPTPPGCGEKKAKKSDRRRTVVLRAPSAEHKAVWQNLIQRQIIYLNTVRGAGSPAGSPLESPELPSLSLTTADSLRDGLSRRGHQPGHQVRDGVLDGVLDVPDEEYEVSLTLDDLQPASASTSPAPPNSITPPPSAPLPNTASTEHDTPIPPPRPRHKVPGRLYSTFPPRPRPTPPSPPPPPPEPCKAEDPYAITIADLPQPPPTPARKPSGANAAPTKPARKASTASSESRKASPTRLPSSARPTKLATLVPPTANSARSSSSASSHGKAVDKPKRSASARPEKSKRSKEGEGKGKEGKKDKSQRPTSTLAFHSPSSPSHELPSCPPSAGPSPAPTPGSKACSLITGSHIGGVSGKPARKTNASLGSSGSMLTAPSTSSYRRRCS